MLPLVPMSAMCIDTANEKVKSSHGGYMTVILMNHVCLWVRNRSQSKDVMSDIVLGGIKNFS